MNDWIKELKIGDEIYTIERHIKIPNGFWKWKSKVIDIQSNYIETEYRRDFKLDWLLLDCNNLAVNHRTFDRQFIKNYFNTLTGEINIEKIWG